MAVRRDPFRVVRKSVNSALWPPDQHAQRAIRYRVTWYSTRHTSQAPEMKATIDIDYFTS